MALPLLLSLLGSGAASAGLLGSLSPLLAGAIGSGLGAWAETGDLEKGLLAGIGGFAGGHLLGGLGGGAASGAAGATPGPLGQWWNALPAGTSAGAIGNFGGMAAGEAAKAALFNPMSTLTQAGIGSALGGQLTSSMLPRDSGAPDEEESSYTPTPPINRDMRTPPAGYRHGYNPEFVFFNPVMPPPGMANGGVVRLSGGGIANALPTAPVSPYVADNPALQRDRKEDPFNPFGGLLSMMHSGGLPVGGILGIILRQQQEQAAKNKSETQGMAAGGAVESPNEKQLVQMATAVIKGQVPEEQGAMILAMFVQTYGEDALRKLVADVQSGKGEASRDEGAVRGPGDGMDDLVPAQMDDGSQDVLLSDGEFVVPADVVSGLGNGSTDAGSQELQAMMSRVREERTGKQEQPKKINVGGLLPA